MRTIGRRWRNHYRVEPVCVDTTRRAGVYMRWFDHEILRTVWSNQEEIAPGVLRSNQPTARRLEKLAKQGVTSVLTLRGEGRTVPYISEKLICDRLGLTLHAIHFTAIRPPEPEILLSLIDLFRRIDKPFLMHCKSGADRVGLASAIYLMAIEGRSVQEARRMLSIRYIHFRWTRTGVMDRVLDLYERTGDGLGFEAWVQTRYDPAALD